MENYKLPPEIEYIIRQMDEELEISLYRFEMRLDNHIRRLKDPGGFERTIDYILDQLNSDEVVGIPEKDFETVRQIIEIGTGINNNNH